MAFPTGEELQSWRQERITQGVAPGMVDAFIARKRRAQEEKIYKPEEDPVLQRGFIEKKVEKKEEEAEEAEDIKTEVFLFSTGAKPFEDLSDDAKSVLIKRPGFEIPEVAPKDPFAAQKVTALDAIEALEDRYGRGDAKNIGTKRDLSLAGKGTFLERLGAKLRPGVRFGTNYEFIQDFNSYKQLLTTIPGVFTQAFGSGAPQVEEMRLLMEAAPNLGTSDKEAKNWFEDMRRLLGGLPKKLGDKISAEPGLPPPTPTGLPTLASEAGLPPIPQVLAVEGLPPISEPLAILPTKETEEGAEIDNKLIRWLAESEFLPIAGSIIGGIGTAPFLAGIPGGAAGAVVGKSVQQGLRELLDPERQDLSDMAKAVAVEGMVDAVIGGAFLGVGKLGSFVFKKALKEPLEAFLPKVIRKALPLAGTKLQKFKKAFGTELADEIVERGIPTTAKEAVDTATTKLGQTVTKLDDLLKGVSTKTDDLVKVLEDAKPEKVSPGLEPGVKEIDRQIAFLKENFPDTVPGKVINQVKRELQEAFGRGLEITKGAKKLVAEVSTKVKEFIEKHAPEAKETNKEIRINVLVKEAGEKILSTKKAAALIKFDDLVIGGAAGAIGGPGVGVGVAVAKKIIQQIANDPFTQAKIIKGYLDIAQKTSDKGLARFLIRLAMRLGISFTAEQIQITREAQQEGLPPLQMQETLPAIPPVLSPTQGLPMQPGITP